MYKTLKTVAPGVDIPKEGLSSQNGRSTVWVDDKLVFRAGLKPYFGENRVFAQNELLLQNSIWLCIANMKLLVLDSSFPTTTSRYKTSLFQPHVPRQSAQ